VSIIRFPRTVPGIADPIGWGRLFRQLNRFIAQDGDDHYELDATLARASDQRLLPLVNASNKLSTQSAQPLTATDAGSNATISIAAHSVQFGFGTVSYSSGSITGLSYSTTYYVYADDPDYEGGTVTYVATTNANLVTAGNGRYYVGRIVTPAAAAGPTGGGWGGGGGGGGSQIP
jgi:hypothetical protein